MAEDFLLRTPEAVAISYDIAGIGSRFLAALVDGLVMVVLEILMLLGCLALYLTGGAARQAAIILALTLTFLLIWGYFALFESLWNGQTPGKRLRRIRVIKVSGYPIGFFEALVRNLVRIIDFLPILYGVGLVSMFISTESRRLGDYAAGTIVVKERSPVRLQDLQAPPRERAPQPVRTPRGAVDPEELEWDLRAISPDDLALIEEFLARVDALDVAARQRIAGELTRRVAGRIGARAPLDPLRFLQRISQLRLEGEV